MEWRATLDSPKEVVSEWNVKISLLALFISLLLIGCAEPSVLSKSEISDKSRVPDSAEAIDLDNNETLDRILAEATDLDSLRTFSITGSLFYYSPNENKPNSGTLYSGWGKELYGNGKVCRLGQFTDGKANGIWAEWYYEGPLESHSIIKEGKKNGLHTTWFENGQKRSQANYRDGKKDGLSTEWFENGQKKSEDNFAKDKLISSVVWKPNGEKCPVTYLKDGNGTRVDAYYEDGTEVIRSVYVDGERVN